MKFEKANYATLILKTETEKVPINPSAEYVDYTYNDEPLVEYTDFDQAVSEKYNLYKAKIWRTNIIKDDVKIEKAFAFDFETNKDFIKVLEAQENTIMELNNHINKIATKKQECEKKLDKIYKMKFLEKLKFLFIKKHPPV